ncbi:MAG: hypothetical protein V3V67_18425 [Myxococcota bacterium]
MPDITDSLELARSHLGRVQTAAYDPIDWTDLTVYGFYALEAAVMAAAAHLEWNIRRNHPAKIEAARRLTEEHGLPEVQRLLLELNAARKATAYGDAPLPEMDAEDVSAEIETYIEAVAALINDE